MKLLDGFNLFFNPAFVVDKLLTLWGGGGGGGKGGDDAEYIPIKPAKVTTGFGIGTANPEKGIYEYTLDPRLAQMRDIFYGAVPQFMPTQQEMDFAKGVSQQGIDTFGRGQEFLNQALGLDTASIAQKYYSDVQNLMSVDRAEEEARLANTLFKQGRTGAAVGTQGGYVNPEQFALLRARELANQQLAIQAEDLGRNRRVQDVGFASNLMGTGLNTYGSGKATAAAPYQTMAGIFGLGTGIEQLGMNNTLGTAMAALPIHAQIQAGRQAVENANAAASGKGGGGLLGAVGQVGSMIGTGGLSSLGSSLGSIWGSASTLGGSIEGLGNVLQYGYGGVSPFAGVGGIENNPYLNWRG